MKKSLILGVLILLAGGWTANKFVTRSRKNNDEKERFVNYAGSYSGYAKEFLTAQAKLHHDKAFAASYRMWKLSPVSELDLSDHFDQETYYRTLGKSISEAARKEPRGDAYDALVDIGKYYGIQTTATTPEAKPRPGTPATPTASPPDKEKSGLGESKLGDKRVIPSSRRRDDHR